MDRMTLLLLQLQTCLFASDPKQKQQPDYRKPHFPGICLLPRVHGSVLSLQQALLLLLLMQQQLASPATDGVNARLARPILDQTF